MKQCEKCGAFWIDDREDKCLACGHRNAKVIWADNRSVSEIPEAFRTIQKVIDKQLFGNPE